MQAAIYKTHRTPTGAIRTRAEVVQLPRGVDGIHKTLQLLARHILAASLQPALRDAVMTIVSGIAAYNAAAEAAAVQYWVQDRIRYTRDPKGAELLQSPVTTIEKGQGDCDDQASLVAALLTSIGHTVRLVAIGPKPGRFAHVYAESFIAGQWVPLETIIKVEYGTHPAAERQRERLNFPLHTANGQNVAGWGSFRKKISKAIKKVAPIAAMALPVIGVTNALALGAAQAITAKQEGKAVAPSPVPAQDVVNIQPLPAVTHAPVAAVVQVQPLALPPALPAAALPQVVSTATAAKIIAATPASTDPAATAAPNAFSEQLKKVYDQFNALPTPAKVGGGGLALFVLLKVLK